MTVLVKNICAALCCNRYAFSKNNLPTMVPVPNSNVAFGEATQMSNHDITRLNNLYKCYNCKYSTTKINEE